MLAATEVNSLAGARGKGIFLHCINRKSADKQLGVTVNSIMPAHCKMAV